MIPKKDIYSHKILYINRRQLIINTLVKYEVESKRISSKEDNLIIKSSKFTFYLYESKDMMFFQTCNIQYGIRDINRKNLSHMQIM